MKNEKTKFLLTKEKEQQNYYLKEQKVLEFANEFWKQLAGDLTSYFDVSRDFIPIQCFNEMESMYEAMMNGDDFYTDYCLLCGKKNKQAVIRIGINGEHNKLTTSLKKNIQYGLIHYLLWLVDLPSEYDKAEFHVIASIYDIPTKPKMDAAEQKKFDDFITFYKNTLTEFSGTSKYVIWKFILLNILESNDWMETAKKELEKINQNF
jgi:hypothetical protein